MGGFRHDKAASEACKSGCPPIASPLSEATQHTGLRDLEAVDTRTPTEGTDGTIPLKCPKITGLLMREKALNPHGPMDFF